jgi:hypothetical protein
MAPAFIVGVLARLGFSSRFAAITTEVVEIISAVDTFVEKVATSVESFVDAKPASKDEDVGRSNSYPNVNPYALRSMNGWNQGYKVHTHQLNPGSTYSGLLLSPGASRFGHEVTNLRETPETYSFYTRTSIRQRVPSFSAGFSVLDQCNSDSWDARAWSLDRPPVMVNRSLVPYPLANKISRLMEFHVSEHIPRSDAWSGPPASSERFSASSHRSIGELGVNVHIF